MRGLISPTFATPGTDSTPLLLHHRILPPCRLRVPLPGRFFRGREGSMRIAAGDGGGSNSSNNREDEPHEESFGNLGGKLNDLSTKAQIVVAAFIWMFLFFGASVFKSRDNK
ncbi:uncharacterized protein LOC112350858 [Selaginella moellendorffii]|uniref:uncharacterized protein LOC112350858 n=1 Tax=Selaginella moellendorffii TaxID=88036 RepID=UPI000D1C81DC|nr:uncharacterized protein LOC112350858 [Selaginella moellendorffii]|eukprot:XP_024543597.1 uncharacterized protein LOC112350858 [Selaginella moellendorffii]